MLIWFLQCGLFLPADLTRKEMGILLVFFTH